MDFMIPNFLAFNSGLKIFVTSKAKFGRQLFQ